jgi:hypothetical protein
MGAGGGPLTAIPALPPTPASMTHAEASGRHTAATIAARSFPMSDPETKLTIVYAGSDPALPPPPAGSE